MLAYSGLLNNILSAQEVWMAAKFMSAYRLGCENTENKDDGDVSEKYKYFISLIIIHE